MNQKCVLHAGGATHGVLLMNSNGIDVALTPKKMQFRATGGILDLYFLAGPTPMDVMNQLTSIIGRPHMPPYWSLGLMHSKWVSCLNLYLHASSCVHPSVSLRSVQCRLGLIAHDHEHAREPTCASNRADMLSIKCRAKRIRQDVVKDSLACAGLAT